MQATAEPAIAHDSCVLCCCWVCTCYVRSIWGSSPRVRHAQLLLQCWASDWYGPACWGCTRLMPLPRPVTLASAADPSRAQHPQVAGAAAMSMFGCVVARLDAAELDPGRHRSDMVQGKVNQAAGKEKKECCKVCCISQVNMSQYSLFFSLLNWTKRFSAAHPDGFQVRNSLAPRVLQH